MESLLHFFDLKQDPFSDAPDDGFFYTNAAIRQVYRALINALAERPGIVALTGEAGTGKTILLGRLCSELRASGHLVIGRCPAGLVFDDLLAVIAEELKIPGRGGEDRAAWQDRVCATLERSKWARPPVLVIDDAERLGGDVVANLPQLLAGPADHSLRILLCGRPEIATRFELPGLAELKRMISVACRLERMGDDDAATYIFHRLRRAGHRGTTLFSAAAINTIVAKATGLPQRINRLCARSLVVAAAAGRSVITSEMVEEALVEALPKDALPIEAEQDLASARRYRAAITGGIGGGIVAAAIVLYALMGREQAPELFGIVTGLYAMAPPREEAAVPGQAVARTAERDGVLPETRSGSTELTWLRLEEAPRLGQAVQGAFDERSPPAARDPAAPIFLQPGDLCHDAEDSCSNGPASADRGDVADGRSVMPASNQSREYREETNPAPITESTTQAEQVSPSVPALIARARNQLEAGHVADPTGDNAVETYRQLLAMGPGPAQTSEIVEQIRLALWTSAHSALKAGKREDAQRFYELAVHPAIDIEDAEPSAKPATQEVDTKAEPAPSGDAAQGAGASDSVGSALSLKIDNTESLDQPKPGQALDRQDAVDAEPGTATPPRASNELAALPATGTAAPAQATDSKGPVGAGTMPNIGNERPQAVIAAGSAQEAHSEGAINSGSSTPPEARPQTSLAPSVMKPAAPQVPAGTIAALIRRGDELLRIGDISAARLAYERAAAGGSAQAMIALGTTYDPSFLNRVNARGLRPDPLMAAEWYRKAAALGDTTASARISQLPALAK
jgi:general secretion pathway protein A